MTDRSERGDCRFADQRVVMGLCELSEMAGDAALVRALTAGPGGLLDDSGIRVVQETPNRGLGMGGREFERGDAHMRMGVMEHGGELLGAEHPESIGGTKRGGTNVGVAVGERGDHGGLVVDEAGHGRGLPALACVGFHGVTLAVVMGRRAQIIQAQMLKSDTCPADGSTGNRMPKERPVSHIVIHDNIDGVTQYRQFDDLGHAVSHVEELRNTSGVEGTKLYALNEVAFEMKPYFRVEVVDAAATAPAAPVESVQPEVLPTAETVTYAEASSAPLETMGRDTTPLSGFEEPAMESVPNFDDPPVSSAGSDARRGLFGR